MYMCVDLISAKYCNGYKIKLVFENGVSGVVDFSPYLVRGGVFEKFRDINFFKNFIVDPEVKTLVWGGVVDIAPETLYAQTAQCALPTWMHT
jgi:hypothetical protein